MKLHRNSTSPQPGVFFSKATIIFGSSGSLFGFSILREKQMHSTLPPCHLSCHGVWPVLIFSRKLSGSRTGGIPLPILGLRSREAASTFLARHEWICCLLLLDQGFASPTHWTKPPTRALTFLGRPSRESEALT